MRFLISLLLLLPFLAFAENPPPRIQDEGGTLAPYFNLNCVGAGVTCTTSGVNATITVPTPTPVPTPNLQAVTTAGATTTNQVTLDGGFQLNDNDQGQIGTGDDMLLYHDGTNGIIDMVTGVLRVGPTGDDDMMVDHIGLGTTVQSALFWISFSQTTTVGRGALSFDYTYTGVGPTLNILSAMRYQGSGTVGLNTRFISEDGSATVNTRTLGIEHLLDITATYNNASIVREFFGLKVDDEDVDYGAAHTNGTVRRWGLLCEDLNAIAGIATDFISCLTALEDIVVADNVRLYLEGSRTTKGDTYLTYDSAGTEIDVVVNGFTQLSIDGTDPTNYSITNITTDRAYDANATTVDELADVLATLVQDLRDRIGLQW